MQSHSLEWDPWNRNRCLQFLRSEGQSRPLASRGLTLLEAFRFAWFVLEIPIPDQMMSDPQLRSRAHCLMAEKMAYKPVRPLKVSELTLLEKTMQGPVDPIDAYMLGAITFAIFLSRSRWADWKNILKSGLNEWYMMENYMGLLKPVQSITRLHHWQRNSCTCRWLRLFLDVTAVDWTKHWVQDSLGTS